MGEVLSLSLSDAVKYFATMHPSLQLDIYGYAKNGDVSYCVAECYDPWTA
jgi:hypothetical protein